MSSTEQHTQDSKKWTVYYHCVPKEISDYDYDKYYIGITSQEDVTKRWGYKGGGYKTQRFYRAINKYGWNNMTHKIVADGLSKDQNSSTIRTLKTKSSE